MGKIILTDSCFWIGLIDPKDQYHSQSMALIDLLENNTIIFPWPCLYETISTHLFRRRDRVQFFETFLKKENIKFISDTEYRDIALDLIFKENLWYGKNISLADGVIREIIKDINVKLDFMVTYNITDFQDICSIRGLEIV